MLFFRSLFIVFICSSAAFSQTKAPADTTINKLFILDSIWHASSSKKDKLQDSVSFFEIKKGRVEYCLKSKTWNRHEKGNVSRWTESKDANGLNQYSFYLTSRGAFKGSLTIKIKEIEKDKYELHILSAFATLDNKMSGKLCDEKDIVRPVKKTYNPSKR